jgi:uncharacterized membrane protein
MLQSSILLWREGRGMQVFTYDRGSAEFDRGVSFFDAVYGFALTLLITTVHVPGPTAWVSVVSLLNSGAGSELFGFVLSFVVISVFWRSNYRLIGTMSAMSSRIVAANIVCVFFIILIPFTTEAMNASVLSRLPLPTALYAVNIALAALAQTVMYQLAKKNQLVMAVASRGSRVAGFTASLAVPFVFFVSVGVAYLAGPHAAQYSWAAALVLRFGFDRLQIRLDRNTPPTAMPKLKPAE